MNAMVACTLFETSYFNRENRTDVYVLMDDADTIVFFHSYKEVLKNSNVLNLLVRGMDFSLVFCCVEIVYSFNTVSRSTLPSSKEYVCCNRIGYKKTNRLLILLYKT